MTSEDCEEAIGLLRTRRELFLKADAVNRAPRFQISFARGGELAPGQSHEFRESVLSVINLSTHLREILLAEYRIRLAENELELRKLGVEPPEEAA